MNLDKIISLERDFYFNFLMLKKSPPEWIRLRKNIRDAYLQNKRK